MTMLTDYVLSVADAYFGWRLLQGAGRARRLWACGFLALAVSAFAGGSYHGLAPMLDPGVHAVLWQITEAAIGIGCLCLLLALARLYLAGTARSALVIFAVAKFVIYVAVAAVTDNFVLAVYDSAATMLITLVLGLCALGIWHHPAGKWLVSGVAVSVAAALIQRSGFALHTHFNHNDLYHVVQLIGMYLLFKGGLQFDRPAQKTR